MVITNAYIYAYIYVGNSKGSQRYLEGKLGIDQDDEGALEKKITVLTTMADPRYLELSRERENCSR